jgi:SpoVK/Ycf46/Vps4 family AAA+-type ATPase
MERITTLINQYNDLIQNIKEEFKNIYDSDKDSYEILKEGIYFLDDKIKSLKRIKNNFSLQREDLENRTNILEEQTRFSEMVGEYSQIKSNIIDINNMFIKNYLNVEELTENTIDYFNSNIENIKYQMKKGEIKLAMKYLKEINEVLKDDY